MRFIRFLPASFALPLLCVAAPMVVALRYDTVLQSPPDASGGFNPNDLSAMRCSSRNMAGVGLQGDYFAQPGMQGGQLLSRVDATVEFDASLDWPADQLATRPQSVRWKGWVKAPLSGRYKFHGEPQARINVAGLPLVGGAAAQDAFLEMSAGQFYPIEMEVDLSSAQPVRLEWTAPHGLRYVIPRALLFLPTAAAS